MPTKIKPDAWQTTPPPETPMQQNAFMESCTLWLIEQPSSPSAPSDVFEWRTHALEVEEKDVAKAKVSHLSYTPLELRNTSVQQGCFLCNRLTTHRSNVTANPFAQRRIILVCPECTGEKRA